MTQEELARLNQQVNNDIEGMAKAQRLRDEVRDAIGHRTTNPMEEQLIDEDSFGVIRGQPRILVVDGIQIKIWKIHRAGLQARDVKGADLFYEISDMKFVLIQYKTPGPNGRVILDADQLSELQSACPVDCPPSDRFRCGSWYAIRAVPDATYFPACEAQQVFGSRKSRKASVFINGLTRKQFHEDFGKCHIGARTKPIEVVKYGRLSINRDRIFFHAQQTKKSRSSA
jgi:hypothetical protein